MRKSLLSILVFLVGAGCYTHELSLTVIDGSPSSDGDADGDGDCVCSSGLCCDGCDFVPEDTVCAQEPIDTEYMCDGSGCGVDLLIREKLARCTGASIHCEEDSAEWTDWQVHEGCGADAVCDDSSGSPGCEQCVYGCSAGSCVTCEPSWTQHLLEFDAPGAVDLQPADIDGDGDTDLVVVAWELGWVSWWENTLGNATSWTTHLITGDAEGPSSVAPADVDDDGDLDVLVTEYAGGRVVWFENIDGSGDAWNELPVDTGAGKALSVRAGDVDDDGDLDVIAGGFNSGTSVRVWKNTVGDGTLWSEYATAGLQVSSELALGDVDNDGSLDIVASRCPSYPQLYLLRNSAGTGTVWEDLSISGSATGGIASPALADFNEDGYLDVAVVSAVDDNVGWWQNMGGAFDSWTSHGVATGFDGAWGLVATDLDGDLDPDLVATAYYGGRVVTWENVDGDGLTWTQTTVTDAFPGALSIEVTDLDGDGDPDLVATSFDEGKVAWWENGCL